MRYIFITSHLSTFNIALAYFKDDIIVSKLNEIYIQAVKRNALFEHFNSFHRIAKYYGNEINSNFEIKNFNALKRLDRKVDNDTKIITTRYDHELTLNTIEKLNSLGYRVKEVIEIGESYGIKPKPYSVRARLRRFLIKLNFKLFKKTKLIVKYCLSEKSFDKRLIHYSQQKLNSYFDYSASVNFLNDTLEKIDNNIDLGIQNEFNDDAVNLILLFPYLKIKSIKSINLINTKYTEDNFKIANNSNININNSCQIISKYIRDNEHIRKINLIIKLHPKNNNLGVNFFKFIKDKIRKNSYRDINVYKLNTSIIVEHFLYSFHIKNKINTVYGFGTNIISSKICLLRDKAINFILVNSEKYKKNSIKSILISYFNDRSEFLRYKHVSGLLQNIIQNE